VHCRIGTSVGLGLLIGSMRAEWLRTGNCKKVAILQRSGVDFEGEVGAYRCGGGFVPLSFAQKQQSRMRGFARHRGVVDYISIVKKDARR
jgi:hypothetical protein